MAQNLLTAHVVAWATIPAELTAVSPIAPVNGNASNGHGVTERLNAFTDKIQNEEKRLLGSLGVSPAFVDQFVNDRIMDREGLYGLLFWQLPLPWVAQKPVAAQILDDMQPLNSSLRRLRKALDRWGQAPEQVGDDDLKTIGVETNALRLFLDGRARFAREISPFFRDEPDEAVSIFYNDTIRRLRRHQIPSSMVESAGLYLGTSLGS